MRGETWVSMDTQSQYQDELARALQRRRDAYERAKRAVREKEARIAAAIGDTPLRRWAGTGQVEP